MERDSNWLYGLKNYRLPNLKILGKGDGPATHGEPGEEEECTEKFTHALYLTKLEREYQAGLGASVIP
jgi:hypothetical protein